MKLRNNEGEGTQRESTIMATVAKSAELSNCLFSLLINSHQCSFVFFYTK